MTIEADPENAARERLALRKCTGQVAGNPTVSLVDHRGRLRDGGEGRDVAGEGRVEHRTHGDRPGAEVGEGTRLCVVVQLPRDERGDDGEQEDGGHEPDDESTADLGRAQADDVLDPRRAPRVRRASGLAASARHAATLLRTGERLGIGLLGTPSTWRGKPGPEEATPSARSASRSQPGVDAPARARRAVASFADGPTDPALSFALELVASELVKNAVLYGSNEEAVRLELVGDSSEIELRVTNRGERIHMSGLRSHREDGGRGLEIVDALCLGWTITSGPLETSISVRMPHRRAVAGAQVRARVWPAGRPGTTTACREQPEVAVAARSSRDRGPGRV